VAVVLADGQVVKTRWPQKTSGRYNLTSLSVDAESTPVIIAEATLRLAVVPNETSVTVVSFPTIKDIASAVAEIIRSSLQLVVLELIDDVKMQVINLNRSESVRAKNLDKSPARFLKFPAPTQEGFQEDTISQLQNEPHKLLQPMQSYIYHSSVASSFVHGIMQRERYAFFRGSRIWIFQKMSIQQELNSRTYVCELMLDRKPSSERVFLEQTTWPLYTILLLNDSIFVLRCHSSTWSA
jgi:FAD/FMN-containing dehydrogenase